MPYVPINQQTRNRSISRLNGKKIMCKGNHDKRYDVELFEGIYDFLEIAVYGINLSLMQWAGEEYLLEEVIDEAAYGRLLSAGGI